MYQSLTPQVSRKTYNSLDLFAGAGGFSIGLLAAGFRSVGAVEINKTAGATYALNFPDCPVQCFGPGSGDLTQLSPRELEKLLMRAGLTELDLLVAGPPCQGFSRVGRGKLASLGDAEDAFLRDPRNKLYHQAIKILRLLRPRVFLFENVAGMLHLGGSNMVEAVCESVARSGYTVRCALLNSGWYGVPQIRERVFILGFRDDLGIEPSFPPIGHRVELSRGHLSDAELDPKNWNNYQYFVPFERLSTNPNLEQWVSVAEAFADLPPFFEHFKKDDYKALRHMHTKKEYISAPPNNYCSNMRNWDGHFISDAVTDHYCRHTPRDFETFAIMKPGDRYPEAHSIAESRYSWAKSRWQRYGGERPQKSEFVPPYSLKGFPDKWRKLVPGQPSWTVTAHLGKDTYSHIHFDSKQKRMITVREAARLQSFPDGFRFLGNTGEVLHQIGNAVPPILGRAMGQEIYQTLRRLDYEHMPSQEMLTCPPTAFLPSSIG